MSLRVYNSKRKFDQTPEPKGKVQKKGQGHLRFVVQMHSASRLHFDFRLEFGGVFRSWAVPKGPSLNPLDQRLAVFVEDHPMEYGSFEGIIPKGNYGAGTVMIWDEGTYVERGSEGRKDSEIAMLKNFEKGHITFVLEGKKLNGEFALIKLKKDKGEKAWLLVKKRDAYSTYKRSEIPDNNSVKTGRTLEEIAEQSEEAGNVWLPKQKKQDPKATQTKVVKTARKKTQVPLIKKPEVPKKYEKAKLAKVDPLPRKNKPMIPTNSRYAVSGKEWIFEPHLDGLRALAEVEGKRVFFYSKSGLPYEKKFPQIVEDLKSLDGTAVFDGEVITNKGKPFYVIYDLLYFKGKDLRKEPLRERKALLDQLSPNGKNIGVVKELKKPEEVSVAKNLESFYKAGTSSDWLLVQASATEPLKKKALEPKITPAKKSATKPSKAHIQSPSSNLEEARLTNLEKVFWPEEGITKGDLLEYYKSISPYILPYLLDRPESLNRQPNGIAAPGFYQKDMTGHIPRWLKTVRYFSESANKSIDYVLVQDERSLLYIVNLGCIEINPWFARSQKPDHPDFMVIDLDPDGNSFDHVIEIAHEVHKILDSVGAPNFCKTSGATGIHIGVPTGAEYDFDEVRELAEMVCRIVAKKYPATTSIDRNPNRRKGKIYLDFMQNRRGQTLAAAYCVRPRSGAPVSMPLTWSELKKGLKPGQFHMKNALRLISKRKDPWKGVLGSPIDLKKCRANLLKKYKV